MKVFVTRKIPEEGLQILKDAGHVVEMWQQNSPMSHNELLAKTKNVDAVITSLSDKIGADFFENNPSLKIVSNYRPSFSNFDISIANKFKIPLTYTPKVNHDAVAEFTFGLILALARHIPAAHKYTNEGNFKYYDPMQFRGTLLKGKTLGIVGMGNIGSRLGKMCAKAMDMNVLYYDESVENTFDFSVKSVDLEILLQSSDVISIHLPPVPSSNGRIGHNEMKSMKDGVLLINTSLAKSLNQSALLQNLRSKKIAGAAIDLVTEETLSDYEASSFREFSDLSNVIITPQISSSTFETRDEMSRMVAADILRVFNGEQAQYIINPEIYTS